MLNPCKTAARTAQSANVAARYVLANRPYMCWQCRSSSSPTFATNSSSLHDGRQRGFPLGSVPKPCIARSFTTTSQQRSENPFPSNPQTHYEYFPATLSSGPPPSGPFHVDLKALRREFLQLQAQAHPDRHAGEFKARAEALSSRINDAYKTLQDPLKRAQYILSLKGHDVENDETASLGDAQSDQELLMVVLEARESIEEASEEGELQGLKDENEERIAQSVELLERVMKDADWEQVKEETTRLRYWMNIRQSIENWEPGKPVMLQH